MVMCGVVGHRDNVAECGGVVYAHWVQGTASEVG